MNPSTLNPVTLRISNAPSTVFFGGKMAVKSTVDSLSPLFEWAWEQGIRSFWADSCEPAQEVLGMLLARLGEDVDHAELMLDLMTAEGRTVFEYLSYITGSLNRLNVNSVDCVMVGIPKGSPRTHWRPYENLGRELAKRKISHGCGASVLYPDQVLAIAKGQMSIIRTSAPVKTLAWRDTKSVAKTFGSSLFAMVSPKDDLDFVSTLFTSGVTLAVDMTRQPAEFVRKIVNGYALAR